MESDFKRKLYTIMKVQRFSVQGSEVYPPVAASKATRVLGSEV